MSKAEEAAWKKYPYKNGMKGLICENSRGIFIQGYQQAEKDLGWHSVEESLPDIGERVLTCVKNDTRMMCLGVSSRKDERWWEDDYGVQHTSVDYWMPIPELPKI